MFHFWLKSCWTDNPLVFNQVKIFCFIEYAKFILTGPYPGVWPAFEKIFQILGDKKIALRDGACIENYISNPETTPENELITELLVPVK